MKVTLTKELETLVTEKVRGGRHAGGGDLARDALRTCEERGECESPALEEALLEGARSPHHGRGPARLSRDLLRDRRTSLP
jgi:Arc/MetJ-type ribon-helix-helix transcriptional regulator